MIHESEVKSFTKRFSSTIIGINVFGFLCIIILESVGVSINNLLFLLIFGATWFYGVLVIWVFYTRTQLKEYTVTNLLSAPAFFLILLFLSIFSEYKTYLKTMEFIVIVVFAYFVQKRENTYLEETQENTQLWLVLIRLDALDILGFRFPKKEKHS